MPSTGLSGLSRPLSGLSGVNATSGGPSDSTAPLVLSATVAANGTSVTIVFSETMMGVPANGDFAFNITNDLTYVSGDGANTYQFTAGITVIQGVSTTLGYTSDGNLTDLAGNPLATFSGAGVTNNSEIALPATGLSWAGRKEDVLTSGSNVVSWPGYLSTGTATIVGTPTVSGGKVVGGVGNYFTLPVPVASAGVFTIYGVATRTASKNWVAFGTAGPNCQAVQFLEGIVGAVDDAGDIRFASADPAGRMLWRLRRDASNVLYYRITGGAEITCGVGTLLTATCTWDTVLTGNAATRFCDASTLIEFQALYGTVDTVTSGTDPAAVAWINAVYGVTW